MRDIVKDRKIGEHWEKEFCYMANDYGYLFTGLQLDRKTSAVAYQNSKRYTLPDIVLWSAPGQFHEIKHKNPTKGGAYGLEVYRLEALLHFAKETNQNVYYTIHNYDLNGGKKSLENNIDHWFTANVLLLAKFTSNKPSCKWGSWINGRWVDNVPMWFWDTSLFTPLIDYWQ